MSSELTTAPIPARFDHLQKLISSPGFLKMESLNNEVPFFICPFAPKDTTEMELLQQQLTNSLKQSGIQVLEINLYDLSVEILKDNGDWDDLLAIEEESPKDALKEQLQSILEPESHLIPAMARKMAEQTFDVMFVSGIGEIFPYIRSHNVLNNLQSTAKDKPTVFFFPGTYTFSLENGASLDLFSRLHDDKYYRAFNIYHCAV